MMMVLSGMSSMEQMKDNLSYMKDFQPLNETELEAVKKVQSIFCGMNLIPCTACRYCTDGCPRQIAHPRPVRRNEHQADLSRLERRLLL